MFGIRLTRRIAIPLISAQLTLSVSALAGDTPVSFNRDIRPILSEHCLACHGFDEESRAVDLRLDLRDNAIARRDDGRAVFPGQPDASEVMRRISSTDEDRMPPPDDHDPLTPGEIDVLRRWILEGAEYEQHWSFVPPTRPQVPESEAVGDGVEDPVNAIDHFVRARLESPPAAPADRATLVRRLSLDLTGLPPSPEEVDAFLADQSPDAYSKLVERLLKSERFGEHFAPILARCRALCGLQRVLH